MSRIRIIRKPAAPGHLPERTHGTLKLRSVKESAEYCKVSTQTIHRAIKSGHLQIYRAGRQIRIDEADLIEYLSQ
jgi:excisionase family DNA binding protein